MMGGCNTYEKSYQKNASPDTVEVFGTYDVEKGQFSNPGIRIKWELE